jgi:signal transduction histidine kinase
MAEPTLGLPAGHAPFGTRELLEGIQSPILVTDTRRRLVMANAAFLGFYGIDIPLDELVGADLNDHLESFSRRFTDPQAFLDGVDRAVEGGGALAGQVLETIDGQLVSRSYSPVRVGSETVAHVWRYEDVTEDRRRARALERSTLVLEAMVRAHGPAIRRSSGTEIFDALLRGLLDVTGSAYGFVGEIDRDEDGAPFLRSWAVTDISWDAQSHEFFDNAMRVDGFLEFRNLDTLFGVTLRTGELVISNDPQNDPRAAGLPPGHPPLVAYLGLPIVHDGRLLGMAGLAGRDGGYETSVVDDLSPLIHACGAMLDSYAIDRERRAAEEALRRALVVAEAADAAKSRLLGRVSHELRTPLNAVLGFSELLGLEETDEQRREWIRQVAVAGKVVLAQVDDLLDLAAAEAGHLSVELVEVALAPLVDEVLDLVAPLAAARDITTSSTVGGALVVADPARLETVLLNLVSNAIKYNRDGGTVVVSAVPGREGTIAVSVADDGPGLAPDKLEQAFVMFERLDAEGSGVQGTGLGLAIALEYTRAIGGELTMRNRESGGAEVIVVLAAASTAD